MCVTGRSSDSRRSCRGAFFRPLRGGHPGASPRPRERWREVKAHRVHLDPGRAAFPRAAVAAKETNLSAAMSSAQTPEIGRLVDLSPLRGEGTAEDVALILVDPKGRRDDDESGPTRRQHEDLMG
jgi:hypothetical protein